VLLLGFQILNKQAAGRFLGATSVVLSLLFVGYELRQNTAVARSEAYRQMVAGFTEFNSMMASDEDIAALWVRMSAGGLAADFDATENWRLRSAYIVLLRQWEGVYHSVEEGVLPETVLPTVDMGGAFATPYMAEIWPGMQGLFSDDFAAFLAEAVMRP
jgi:hypothetical protein